MKTRTYTPINHRGNCSGTVEVEYTQFTVVVGGVKHRLALHKNRNGSWMVADPKSGATILREVTREYSREHGGYLGMKLSTAIRMAKKDIHDLVDRTGEERFNALLAG